jgi:hypothetical protein
VTITDPVFGTLKHNHWSEWMGVIYLQAFDREIPVSITGDSNTPPSKIEQQCLAEFLQNQDSHKSAIEKSILQYINDEDFGCSWSNDEKEMISIDKLKAEKSVWSLITLEEIRLNCKVGKKITLGFTTSWDEEHGLDATFFDNRLGLGEGGIPWDEHKFFDLNGIPL